MQFKKYLIIDAGLGNNMDIFNSFYAKVSQFNAAGRKEDVAGEMKNFQLSVYQRLSGFDFRFNSLAVLIHSIDGETRTNITEDGVTATLKELDAFDLTTGKALEILEKLKKNFLPNWN